MSENPQYIGNLKRHLSKENKTEYFKGRIGNVPVVAFWGRKDPEKLNIKLDVGLIKWIDEQEPKPKSDKQESNPFDSDDDPGF